MPSGLFVLDRSWSKRLPVLVMLVIRPKYIIHARKWLKCLSETVWVQDCCRSVCQKLRGYQTVIVVSVRNCVGTILLSECLSETAWVPDCCGSVCQKLHGHQTVVGVSAINCVGTRLFLEYFFKKLRGYQTVVVMSVKIYVGTRLLLECLSETAWVPDCCCTVF